MGSRGSPPVRSARRGTEERQAPLTSPRGFKVWGQLGDSRAPRAVNAASSGPVNAALWNTQDSRAGLPPLHAGLPAIAGDHGGPAPKPPVQAAPREQVDTGRMR